jgi:hypothetical protein
MRYWDVFPKYIRMTKPLNPEGFLPVPISIRGTPLGTPIFEVSNPEVATVDADGNVMPGATREHFDPVFGALQVRVRIAAGFNSSP